MTPHSATVAEPRFVTRLNSVLRPDLGPVVIRPFTPAHDPVPNVTYSCGAQVHGRMLILPYAIVDRLTTLARCSDELVG